MHASTHPTRSPATPPRGFTLIEMIVVVTVLAIMAAMVIPRFTGNQRREFRLTVDQVSDLLTMYAQRESLGQKIVGLQHNYSSNELRMMLLDYDNAQPGMPAHWRPDVYVAPVALPGFMRPDDLEIWADGEFIDTSDWPLSTELGQDRPMIEIVLRGAGESARLLLAPYAVAPVNMEDRSDGVGVRERIDLDATGRSREDW